MLTSFKSLYVVHDNVQISHETSVLYSGMILHQVLISSSVWDFPQREKILISHLVLCLGNSSDNQDPTDEIRFVYPYNVISNTGEESVLYQISEIKWYFNQFYLCDRNSYASRDNTICFNCTGTQISSTFIKATLKVQAGAKSLKPI